MAVETVSGCSANWMNFIPDRTAISAVSRTPRLMTGGVLCDSNMLLVFFGLPMPSFSRSQLSASARLSG